MELKNRLNYALPETIGVALWVFVSAGVGALLTWMSGRPEFLQYSGLINVLLYFLKELKQGKEVE